MKICWSFLFLFIYQFAFAQIQSKLRDSVSKEGIIGTAKRWSRKTKIDLLDLNIVFPENGFFIAWEWLIISENKHEYEVIYNGFKEKRISYEPAFGVLPTGEGSLDWMKGNGEWFKIISKEEYNLKFRKMAIELSLAN